MRLLCLLAAVAVTVVAATASAREIELEVRGARVAPTATLFYGAHRCIPFVSCRFELNLLGGPSRFEPKDWRRRLEARRDGDAWRLRVNPRPWTLGAYILEAAVIEVGDGARVHVNFRGERPSTGDDVRVQHFLDAETSGHDVGAPDAVRRVAIEVQSRPTLASFLEGIFLASEDAGWRWDEARAQFAHASGATLTPAHDETGFVTLRVPADAPVELPVRWLGFWRRDQNPAGMSVERVAVAERAMRDTKVTVLEVRSTAYALGAGPTSPVDRTLVVDASSWAALRALPAAPGIEAEVVPWSDGTPRALAVRGRPGAPRAVVCIAAWHAGADALGPACAQVEVR